jgi:hypothetical protein
MKRVLLSAVMLGVAGLFAGCGDETKTTEKVSAPGGTTTTTESVKSSGSNPPANAAGETGKTATPAPK